MLLAFCWKVPSNAKTAAICVPAAETKTRFGTQGLGFEQMHFFSKTGAFTGDMLKKAVDKFCDLVECHSSTGLERFLILDNCSYQKNVSMIEAALKRNLVIVWLPSNTTHVLQPLDQAPFANFKRKLAKFGKESLATRTFAKETVFTSLVNATIQALSSTMTPQAIKSGFKKTGVWPWSAETVLANVQAAVVTQDDPNQDDAMDVEVAQVTTMVKSVVEARVPSKVKTTTKRVDAAVQGSTSTDYLAYIAKTTKAKSKKTTTKKVVKKAVKKRAAETYSEETSESDGEWSGGGAPPPPRAAAARMAPPKKQRAAPPAMAVKMVSKVKTKITTVKQVTTTTTVATETQRSETFLLRQVFEGKIKPGKRAPKPKKGWGDEVFY